MPNTEYSQTVDRKRNGVVRNGDVVFSGEEKNLMHHVLTDLTVSKLKANFFFIYTDESWEKENTFVITNYAKLSVGK